MKSLSKLVLVLCLLPAASFARDTLDSCGLGWEVMPDKTLIGTTVRGTTNYFIPPSFGMTFGTMGCEKHEIAESDRESADYAVTNFETLKVEMAQGQGETLTGFANIMGCEAKAFNSMTKDNYQSIISSPETSAVEMYKNVKTLVKGTCTAS